MGKHYVGMVVGLACLATALTGCGSAYMQNRANDAKDMIDIGLTFNDQWTPKFGCYFDFFNSIPMGYSNFEGKILGMGNRQFGWLDYRHESWGVFVWGSEHKGTGVFNPKDPHQARPDQRDLTERPRFNTGLVRIHCEPENRPPNQQYVECDRIIHLGWFGFSATMHPGDIIDFFLGWFGLDIMNDDIVKDPTP